MDEKVAKKSSTDAAKNRARPREDSDVEPNKILFLENLPDECSTMMLGVLFQQYPGYQEARLVPEKNGIAFVEFEDASQATAAKDSLQDFKITPTNAMKITYARA